MLCDTLVLTSGRGLRQLKNFLKDPPPHILIGLEDKDMLTWYYLLMPPPGNPYHGGAPHLPVHLFQPCRARVQGISLLCRCCRCVAVAGAYWGKLKFPKDYPFKPPQIQMITPNGRFKTVRP